MENNIFINKMKINKLKEESVQAISNYMDHWRVAADQVLEDYEKLTQKGLMYLFISSDLGTDNIIDYINEHSPEMDLSYLDNAPEQYSRFNLLAYYRLVKGRYLALKSQLNELKGEAKRCYYEVCETVDTLESDSRLNDDHLIELLMLKSDLEGVGESELTFQEPGVFLDTVFIEGDISKDEFLSIVNVDHDNLSIMEYVNSLPESIDLKTFKEACFVHVVERDTFYHQLIFKELQDTPHVKEQMNEYANEVVREMGIPRYSVSLDHFGEVVEMERCKPEFRLVEGGRQ